MQPRRGLRTEYGGLRVPARVAPGDLFHREGTKGRRHFLSRRIPGSAKGSKDWLELQPRGGFYVLSRGIDPSAIEWACALSPVIHMCPSGYPWASRGLVKPLIVRSCTADRLGYNYQAIMILFTTGSSYQ